MLIGHYAPALILQRARPSLKLWQLFVAAQLVDLGWALCVLAGVEKLRIVPGFTASNDLDLWFMPYTHSLVATGVWSLLAFLGWLAIGRPATRVGDAVVFAAVVASHFVLDFVVHAHDLPLAGGGSVKLGLGLWSYKWAAVVVECGLFVVAALWWWRGQRQPARGIGWTLVGMTAFALASFFVPTPPSATMMALTGLATWVALPLLVAWQTARGLA